MMFAHMIERRHYGEASARFGFLMWGDGPTTMNGHKHNWADPVAVEGITGQPLALLVRLVAGRVAGALSRRKPASSRFQGPDRQQPLRMRAHRLARRAPG